MAESEEFVLTLSEDGFGKRTSSYEYRIAGRGGKGLDSMDLRRGDGAGPSTVVASFPVIDSDHIVMVTDGGQIIRCPVGDISFVGRKTRGVTSFKTADDERVVSVTRLRDVNGGDEDDGANGADPVTGDADQTTEGDPADGEAAGEGG
jgi:DNA gyrase subunit A